jgi:hypothetical protein
VGLCALTVAVQTRALRFSHSDSLRRILDVQLELVVKLDPLYETEIP